MSLQSILWQTEMHALQYLRRHISSSKTPAEAFQSLWVPLWNPWGLRIAGVSTSSTDLNLLGEIRSAGPLFVEGWRCHPLNSAGRGAPWLCALWSPRCAASTTAEWPPQLLFSFSFVRPEPFCNSTIFILFCGLLGGGCSWVSFQSETWEAGSVFRFPQWCFGREGLDRYEQAALTCSWWRLGCDSRLWKLCICRGLLWLMPSLCFRTENSDFFKNKRFQKWD